ncbi:protein FAR1-RELATED SEQUENCE 5-like [Rutidosis leptorrhynchoides]|uniref:protein FAR1-RELATED SEQUENCE 5-like n=1 Tax=Rutidosis leptorrhynchoides TaxID=125765 RepID=UPI003A99928E
MSDIEDELDQLHNEDLQNTDGEANQVAVFDSLDLEPINVVNEISSPNRIEGAFTSSVPFYTPKGSIYFIPEVETTYKPVIGTTFNSIEEALVFYQSYAERAGFTVRKYTAKHKANGDLSHRLFVCNRQGKPNKKTDVDSLQHVVGGTTVNNRMLMSKRMVYGFVENHNHVLDIPQDKHFTKVHRQLEYEDRRFIQTVGKNNIEPVKAYRLRACLKGGYDQVRGTAVDYKNHQRDVNVCIGERDAQMLIDRFSKRKLNNPEFCFHYKTEKDELVGLFWADETSWFNYQEFGAVLAFDATYNTNR